MKKGKLIRFTAMFFAMMLAFTLLSRAADSSGVAVVTTSKPAGRTLSHTITATGKIVQNQELAVTTVADLRVKSIAVSEGDRVSEGDLLFELDEEYLDEQILYQEQEMEIQELALADIESQKSVSSQQKANEQASASEQYALSTQSASLTLSRAKEALQEAKDALTEYRNSSGTTTSADSSVETALEKAVEEKTEDYIDAQQELLALQWKIENAVNEALKAAQSSASLTGTSTTKTQSAGESASGGTDDADILQVSEDADMMSVSEDEAVIEETDSMGESNSTRNSENADSDGSTGNAGMGSSTDSGSTASNESISDGNSTVSDDAVIIEDVEMVESSAQTGNLADTSSSTQSESTTGTISGTSSAASSEVSGTSSDTMSADSNTSTSASLTQEELDTIEEEVRDSYSTRLTAAQKAVDTALAEKEAAESALEEYQAELLALASASNSETESQLIANLKSAQEAYEDAALAANEAEVTAARNVASANIPDASDSSVRQQEIAYEQMELTLNKLQELKEDGGKVYAPADGLITGINITVGEKTSDGTAVKMADISKGFRFTAELSKEDQQYIGAGDLVTLTGNGGNTVEGLEVDSVTADDEEEDIYNIVVQVPDDSFELGAAVTLEYTKTSGVYSVCVPISALYMDDYNQPYVLVTDEYETVMGTEIKARSVSVTVLENDGTYAALQEGAISSDQQVITGADKAIEDGNRVRTES
ncbi:MAG: biotin/lipoyl-binding protein [Lachnospiraceae bacterium]|nr:biotin/lipoyl-binding protein [Lachnospiraceae bacterium]